MSKHDLPTDNKTVDVYRVEGKPNEKVYITEDGDVSFKNDGKVTWLNFGDKERAYQFFNKRVKGKMESPSIKTFKSSEDFLEKIRQDAVPESMHRANKNKPIISLDPYPDQYGIPSGYLDDLQKSIVPDSGKVIKSSTNRSKNNKNIK